jgi:endonuclease/exonuclease/phosphatase (EEP) superfamily protein YafD
LNVHLRPAVEGGNWIRGFVTTPPLRRREIEAHWQQVDDSLPTIVAGDFNEDPDGRAIDFLAGHGLTRVPTTGPTSWHYERIVDGKPWDLLKMDIDHVLVDDSFTAKDARVLDTGASDHRPVVVTIQSK